MVELARVLGFDKDGLVYQAVSGWWFIVSTPRFEQETGSAVRSRGGAFAIGLPVLPRSHHVLLKVHEAVGLRLIGLELGLGSFHQEALLNI